MRVDAAIAWPGLGEAPQPRADDAVLHVHQIVEGELGVGAGGGDAAPAAAPTAAKAPAPEPTKAPAPTAAAAAPAPTTAPAAAKRKYPKVKLRYKPSWAWIKSVEKLGQYKVRITSNTPVPDGMMWMAYNTSILPQHVHEPLANKADFAARAIGNRCETKYQSSVTRKRRRGAGMKRV